MAAYDGLSCNIKANVATMSDESQLSGKARGASGHDSKNDGTFFRTFSASSRLPNITSRKEWREAQSNAGNASPAERSREEEHSFNWAAYDEAE
mmetsp:Transcript_2655/g.3968  ORF Transcript_2655/g.3968 Transcript_2655/m.3968 type:complete len:94 (-) Transcript_2655:1303-1584(-)